MEKLKTSGLYVATGQFGAMMGVNIENDREGCSRSESISNRGVDGPVTLLLEKDALK